MFHARTLIPAAFLLAGLAVGTTALAAEPPQLPATKHQAQTVPDAHRKTAVPASTKTGMPETKHQKQVLRDFEAADTNKDGQLSRDEYADYMQKQAALRYEHSLEQQGTESGGPRDRSGV